jgi:hypothetical protein
MCAGFALAVLTKPARADLVMLFLDSPTQVINDFVPFGNQAYTFDDGVSPPFVVPAVNALNNPFAPVGPAQAGSITIPAGQTRIIQVALFDSLIGNTFPPLNPNAGPASSIPAGLGTGGTYFSNPRWLSTASGQAPIPQMFGLVYWEARIQGTVMGPANAPTGGAFIQGPSAVPGVDPDWGNNRIALVDPYAAFFNAGSSPPIFSNFGGLRLTGRGTIPNQNYGASMNAPELGGRLALFNFEISTVGTDPGGTYPITIVDHWALNDFEVYNANSLVGQINERIILDSVIFSAAHPSYTLNVTVTATPVPEPSSFALVGMVLVGLGYKFKSRRAGDASLRVSNPVSGKSRYTEPGGPGSPESCIY